MQIIHHLTIDMARHLPLLPIDAVQNDASTRSVELSLLENGSPWEVPGGVTGAVAFRKSDGTRGLYDTLPDGTSALSFAGSTVTAVLAPQVLTCPGEVSAAVVFYDQGLNRIATFPLVIRVARDPAAGNAISNDYYRYTTMAQLNNAAAVVEAAVDAQQGRLDWLENATAIICQASGGALALSGSAWAPLQGISLFGRTGQAAVPTPDAPAPMNHAGSSGSITVTLTGGSAEQCLTARTPNGLPGIPVASGGNYTDENGQPWACDEIDFARGVYVQRIAKYSCTGASDEYWADGSLKYDGQSLYVYRGGGNGTKKAGADNVLCSHFPTVASNCSITGAGNAVIYFYIPVGIASTINEWLTYLAAQAEAGTPVEYIYELETPVETALSAQELAQFAALYSNKPNTTVTNDSGAGMRLSYVADTKTYIDTTTADISGVSPEDMRQAVADYLEENPVEAPVVSVNGKTGSVELTAEDVGAIPTNGLQSAVNDALAQAKASGEFDGTGIDVSGAEVGQIVQIAAVDENGVPTEWIPANLPTGGSEWRKIRTVTIPEDISADTSGVAFAEKEGGGVTFAFDTDEDGQAFAISELLIRYNAATPHTQQAFTIANRNTPVYTTATGQFDISTRVTIGVNDTKKLGFSYTVLTHDGTSLSWGAAFGGGANNNVQSAVKHATLIGSHITAIDAFMMNLANYGFSAGSEFVFYGR